MGTNSYLYIEVRDKRYPSLGWHVWAENILESRNYELYAAMAGVRGDGPPPKGLPPDVSQHIEKIFDDMAFHSCTHLTPLEYRAAYDKAGRYNCGKEWCALMWVLMALLVEYGEANVRLIVGFDS